MSLEKYLNNCWEVFRSGNTVWNSINSILHIYSAHIIHRFSQAFQRKSCSIMANKSTKKVIITYYMPIYPLWTGLILGPAIAYYSKASE